MCQVHLYRTAPTSSLPNPLPRQALDEAGLASVPFDLRVVSNQGDADRYGFTGSPTIQINGIDPFAEPGQPLAVACQGLPRRTRRPRIAALFNKLQLACLANSTNRTPVRAPQHHRHSGNSLRLARPASARRSKPPILRTYRTTAHHVLARRSRNRTNREIR